MGRRWWIGLVALAACTAAGLAGWRSPAPADTPRLVPLTPAVASAYQGYWNAWRSASAAADPQSPELAAHAGNPHLEVLRANLTDQRNRHQLVEGDVTHSIRGMRNAGGWYTVTDCVDLHAWILVDEVTRQPVDQLVNRPHQLTEVTLEPVGGRLLVTHAQLLGDC